MPASTRTSPTERASRERKGAPRGILGIPRHSPTPASTRISPAEARTPLKNLPRPPRCRCSRTPQGQKPGLARRDEDSVDEVRGEEGGGSEKSVSALNATRTCSRPPRCRCWITGFCCSLLAASLPLLAGRAGPLSCLPVWQRERSADVGGRERSRLHQSRDRARCARAPASRARAQRVHQRVHQRVLVRNA